MQKIIVKSKRFTGFSIIELLVVILLLGILSVFALGRMFDGNQFAARGFFDDTVNAVRFAQKLAVSTGCDVQVQIDTNSYELRRSSSCTADDFTDMVKNPANRSNDYQNTDIPNGYSFSPNSTIITFNARGVTGGANQTVTLSGGPDSFSFTVYGETGLVNVN